MTVKVLMVDDDASMRRLVQTVLSLIHISEPTRP